MALPLATDYPFMNILWSTLIFVAFIMWFWLVIMCFVDIFRRHDMGGFAKAIWIIFIIFIPLLGVLIYLIAYNDGIAERSAKQSADAQAAFDAHVQGRRRQRRRRGGDRARQGAARLGRDHAGGVRSDQGEARWPARSTASTHDQGRETDMSSTELELGPVDVVVIGYPPDAPRTGEAIPLLLDLVDRGIIRILDVVGIEKSEDGTINVLGVTDVDGDGFPDLVAFEGAQTGMLGDEDLADGRRGDGAGVGRGPDRVREQLGGPVRDRGAAQRRHGAGVPARRRPRTWWTQSRASTRLRERRRPCPCFEVWHGPR